MRSSLLTLSALLFQLHPLHAQGAPVPRDWMLGLSAIQIVPGAQLTREGRLGLGTDFQLARSFAAQRVFAGIEIRLGGVGPVIELQARDSVPLVYNENTRAQNSLTLVGIPVRYFLSRGALRPYLFGSVGYAFWGYKLWNETGGESPGLVPTSAQKKVEFAEGIGFLALAHAAHHDWYLDLGLRRAASGKVPYLLRRGFTSVNGRTTTTLTPIDGTVYLITVGATALLP